MKAIETQYKGYRFRSRLEARWAVFFDMLGIEWRYEPEGFELSDGTRYLPDFHLPAFEGGMWVEVKPENGDWAKAKLFATDSSSKVWLAYGEPGASMYDVVYPDGGIVPECVPLGSEAHGENRMYVHTGPELDESGFEGWLTRNAPHVLSAVMYARAARFEHGESPDRPDERLRAVAREGWIRYFRLKHPDIPREVWDVVLDMAQGE